MKKRIFIVLGIIVVIFLLIYGIIFYIDYRNITRGKLPIFASEVNKETYQGLGYLVNVKYYEDTENIETMDLYLFGKHVGGVVICYDSGLYSSDDQTNNSTITIKDGKIQNENLLDDFIEKANNKQNANLQIDIISDENKETINLEYIIGKYYINNDTTSTTNMTAPDRNWNFDYYQEYYGYYKLVKNGEEESFDDYHFDIIRETNDNVVSVIFYSEMIDLIEIPKICEYNLDSSSYKKIYGDLIYNQRKDVGIEQIAEKGQFDNSDFGLYTFGGDVLIIVEGDMAYSLEDALSHKVITVQDILDQAKLDEKYGICQISLFNDGGSIEYRYKDYTILKYNTLDGNKDLFIAMSESLMPDTIINFVNEIGY